MASPTRRRSATLGRIRSFSFRPTLREAGALRHRYPRWRNFQVHGDTLYRLAQLSSDPRRGESWRYSRLGLRRYAGWWLRHDRHDWLRQDSDDDSSSDEDLLREEASRERTETSGGESATAELNEEDSSDLFLASDFGGLAARRFLRDGANDPPTPPFREYWLGDDARGIDVDALADLEDVDQEELDDTLEPLVLGHSSPLGQRLGRLRRESGVALRPGLRRQVTPGPLTNRNLSRGQLRRQRGRRGLRSSWNQLLVRQSQGQRLVTRLSRSGLIQFFGGSSQRALSLQKYLRRTVRRRAPALRRAHWRRTFQRFYRSSPLEERRRWVNWLAMLILGTFHFRTPEGFNLSWKTQRRWERIFLARVQDLWLQRAQRLITGGRRRRRDEGRILSQIYQEWSDKKWDEDSTWFKATLSEAKDAAMHRRAVVVHGKRRWEHYLWKNLRGRRMRRRVLRSFRSQRSALHQGLASLAGGLRQLAALRRRLTSAGHRRRSAALARELRLRARRWLPLLFQQLPLLSRGNLSLADTLWLKLGGSFRRPGDRRWGRWIGGGPLLASLGVQKPGRLRSGFLGYLSELADQPLANGRLRRFFDLWKSTEHHCDFFPRSTASDAPAATETTLNTLGGGATPLAAALVESRFQSARDRSRMLLRGDSSLHSVGDFTLLCKEERLLTSFLTSLEAKPARQQSHLTLLTDLRQRRELSVEQKKYFREIRRDPRLELPRAKGFAPPRRRRRGGPPPRARDMILRTHWAIPQPGPQLERLRRRRTYPRRRRLGRVNVRQVARLCLLRPRNNFLRPFGLGHRSAYRLRRRRRRENFGWRTLSQLMLGMNFWMERSNLHQDRQQRRLRLRRSGLILRSQSRRSFRYGSKPDSSFVSNSRSGRDTALLLGRHGLFFQWHRLLRQRGAELSRQRQLRMKTPVWFQSIKTRSSRTVRVNFARGLISYSKRSRALLGTSRSLAGRRRRLRRRRQLRRPLLRWLTWRCGNTASFAKKSICSRHDELV